MKKLGRVIFCFAVLLCIQPAMAEDDMQDNSEEFSGRIDGVDLNARKLIVNDWVYRLALDLKVHGKAGLETDFALREGRFVKFEVSPETVNSNVPTIRDIWIADE
jgi:hypothetical protein